LDTILVEKSSGWKNIVFDCFGDQVCKRKWEPDDDQLLFQSGHLFNQCMMTPIGQFDEF
jgi:hypothetical protein